MEGMRRRRNTSHKKSFSEWVPCVPYREMCTFLVITWLTRASMMSREQSKRKQTRARCEANSLLWLFRYVKAFRERTGG